MTDYQPSAIGDVSCDASEGHSTLVFVRDLRHSPEAVWAALTRPEELPQWAPFTPDRDLAALGPATLTMIAATDGGPFEADVRRAEPYERLEYTWGDDLLVWELIPHDGGTRLTLRHTLSDPSLLAIVAAGWHVCLDVAERHLDDAPIGPFGHHDSKGGRLHSARGRSAEPPHPPHLIPRRRRRSRTPVDGRERRGRRRRTRARHQ